MSLSKNLIPILFLALIGSISMAPLLFPEITREAAHLIQENVGRFGIWGPVAMVVLIILATIFSPIPNSLITIAIGATYGVIPGIVITLIGSILASTLAFFLSRRFGAQFVQRFFPKEHSFHRFLVKNAFSSIFVLRLIPTVSFDMISYGAGLTKIPWKTFIAATFLGIIPQTISLVLVGSGITIDNTYSWFGAGLYAILVFLGLYLGHKMGILDDEKKTDSKIKK